MSLLSAEYCKVTIYVPDPSFVGFVAKIQKAKTRKNKDYYILRTTVPKEIAGKMNVAPGDFVFFKAKKAQWYHMINWEAMENTWKILPREVQSKVISDGLYGNVISSQQMQAVGATNLSLPPPMIEAQIK